MTKKAAADEPGYPLGKRTTEPHHKDGWFPERKSAEPTGDPLPPGVEGHSTGGRK